MEAARGIFCQVSKGTVIVHKSKRETTIMRIIFSVCPMWRGVFGSSRGNILPGIQGDCDRTQEQTRNYRVEDHIFCEPDVAGTIWKQLVEYVARYPRGL